MVYVKQQYYDRPNSWGYIIDRYTFTNYLSLSHEEKKEIWGWRNHPSVRKWMFNSNEINMSDHMDFIDNLEINYSKSYWRISYNDIPIGCCSIDKVEYESKSGEIGLYYRPDKQNHSPFGIDFVYNIYNFMFNILGFNTLYGEIKQNNTNSLSLAEFLGGKKISEYSDGDDLFYNLCISSETFNQIKTESLNPKNYLNFIKQNYIK